MANIASACKRARRSAASAERNKVQRSNKRSRVRKVEEAIAAGNVGGVHVAFRDMQSALATAGRTSLVHSKMASRKSSRVNAKIRAMAGVGSAPDETSPTA